MSTRYKYLNFKEKRFLNKLLKKGILVDFDNEENNISAVEIEKLRFITSKFKVDKFEISYEFIKKLSIHEIIAFEMYTDKWKNVEGILKYDYDLKELLSKIIFPYLIAKASTPMDKVIVNQVAHNCNIDEIVLNEHALNYAYSKASYIMYYSEDYTIDQIIFLLDNNMIYPPYYHETFDYDEIYNIFKESQLDNTWYYYGYFPLEFIKKIPLYMKKFKDESELKAVLLKLLEYCKRNKYNRYEKIFDIFIKYEFTIDEIMIICTQDSQFIRPQFLIPYFCNGGKKSDLILKTITENN